MWLSRNPQSPIALFIAWKAATHLAGARVPGYDSVLIFTTVSIDANGENRCGIVHDRDDNMGLVT